MASDSLVAAVNVYIYHYNYQLPQQPTEQFHEEPHNNVKWFVHKVNCMLFSQ